MKTFLKFTNVIFYFWLLTCLLTTCKKVEGPVNETINLKTYIGNWEDEKYSYLNYQIDIVNDTVQLDCYIHTMPISRKFNYTKNGKLYYRGSYKPAGNFEIWFDFELTFTDINKIALKGLISDGIQNYDIVKILKRSSGIANSFSSSLLIGTWVATLTNTKNTPRFEFFQSSVNMDSYMYKYDYATNTKELKVQKALSFNDGFFQYYRYTFTPEIHGDGTIQFIYDLKLIPLSDNAALGILSESFISTLNNSTHQTAKSFVELYRK